MPFKIHVVLFGDGHDQWKCARKGRGILKSMCGRLGSGGR